MKVYISPSTQENNLGVGNYGTEENRMNLIGDVAIQLLQYNHFEVYRNKPEMTLEQAVADSNSKGVDIHFAIHSNAFNKLVRGGEIFYKSENGKKLASCVYKYLEPLTPTSDRGVKLHEHLYELNQTKAIAALVEVAFHDNTDDAIFIMNNIQALGEAIAHGICDYFNVEFKQPATMITFPPDFDPIGYLECNKDIVEAQMSPWHHYLNHGYKESARKWTRKTTTVEKIVEKIVEVEKPLTKETVLNYLQNNLI